MVACGLTHLCRLLSRPMGQIQSGAKHGPTKTIQMIPFVSERKSMSEVTDLHSGHYNIFPKGTPETLTKKSTGRLAASKNQDHG